MTLLQALGFIGIIIALTMVACDLHTYPEGYIEKYYKKLKTKRHEKH